MKKRWRFLTISELAAVLMVIAVIAIALFSRLTIFSPGRLNAQGVQSPQLALDLPTGKDSPVVSGGLKGVTNHAELTRQCGACHAPPWSAETMVQRCLWCHTDVASELQNPHDLHYMATSSIESLTCTNGCHTEHNGPAAPLTLVKSEHFNSLGLKFSLKGHKTNSDGLSFSCVDCHLNGLDKFKPDTCVTCHAKIDSGFTQTHINTFGQDCMKCHDGLDTYGKAFNHSQVDFKLIGAHSSPSIVCGDCHESARTIEELKSAPTDCLSCHQKDDKHQGAFGNDCAQCHNEFNWKQINFDHQKTTYPLTGKHFTADCLACHVDNVLKGLPQDCSSCHQKDDKHEGKLNNCSDCHTTSEWKQVTFDHKQTAYPLTGKHITVDCASCHIDNIYKGTPQDCSNCHQKDDKHEGSLGQNCVLCHATTDWQQITFKHDTTSYPLTGKHIAVDCTSCHSDGVLKGTPNDCYSCHQKKDKHGGALGQNCVLCHLTTDWQQITFTHDISSYPLTGKHITVDCTSCHSNGVLKGTPNDCYTCHQKDDKHAGALGQNCIQCHTTTNWKDVIFNHSKTDFPLIDSHASVACTSCHKNGLFKGTPQNCDSCHQPPVNHFGSGCSSCHNTSHWAGASVHQSFSASSGAPVNCNSCHQPPANHYGPQCSSCHNNTDWTQATVDHSLTAFPLTGKHTSVVCASCHINGVYKGTAKDCYTCHKSKDTHNSANGTNCASCHNTTDWTQATVDHSLTAFPLTGKHTSVACASCHVNGVYKGTAKDCYTCHKSNDTHNGSNGTDCASCHNTTDWSQATVDHSLSAFPLTGKHMSVACTACHVSGVYKGTPKDCYTCHKAKDTHSGSLGTDCASCHTTSGWPTTTINHVTQTAFPLTGKHTSVACVSCHVNGVYKGTPTDCYTCHQAKDFHSGSLGTNCASCHTTSGWPTTTINHVTQTAFPLTGKHTSVACVSCHVNGVYKGTPTDCYTCHQAKDFHSGSLGTNCASCHTTSGWPTTTINHVTQTAFALTGKHTSVACAACHVNGVYKGTPKDCYTCHKSNDTHKGTNGTNCASCHNTTDWSQATVDHSLSGFPLTGKHTSVACAACHVNGVYKGTPKDCYTCHKAKDFHSGSLGTNCASCHTTAGWPTTTIDHVSLTAFSLTGKHTSVACASCHVNGVYKGIAKDCYTCHKAKDTHSGSLGTNCASCHTTSGWPTTTINHVTQTAFPLTGKHTSVACVACHVNGVYKGTPTDCYTCHQAKDFHSGSLGTNCASCHTTTGWPTTTINHVTQTAFALTGKHTSVACAACHGNGVYKGTPKDCYTCHKSNDTHKGTNGTNCASCHNTTDWSQATVDHSLSGFPLTGKHTSVACTACHVNGVYKGTPKDCYTCHKAKDFHSGSLGTNCASCHTTAGWPTTTIDHVSLTAFSLTGKHTSVACTACHVNGVYKGTAKDCYTCHKSNDAHLGSLGTTCSECHATSGWTPATYNRVHTFPKNHGGAAICKTCHPNTPGNFLTYSCYGCHQHTTANIQSAHSRIANYQNCIQCHVNGRSP